MGMTLEDIRLFTEVVACGGISEAARRANMAQQTVSRRILNLEREMGCVLFERTTPITLTAAGSLFLNYAHEVGALTRAVQAQMKAVARRGVEVVRIKRYGTDSFFRLLSGAVDRLHAEHPETKIELVPKNEDDCDLVREGVIDIGFMRVIAMPGAAVDPAELVGEGLACTPLRSTDFELVFAAPPAHPLHAVEQPRLRDVADYAIATPSFESRGPIPRALERLFEHEGLPLHVDMVYCQSMLEYYALARPLSVYTFNEVRSAEELSSQQRRFVPIPLADGPLTVRSYAVHRAGDPSPTVAAVLGALRDADAALASCG